MTHDGDLDDPVLSCWLNIMTTHYAAYNVQREERVCKLKKKLYEALIQDDGGMYLAKTGSFLRSRSLRTRENQRIFSIIAEASEIPEGEDSYGQQRFWTKRVLFEALKGLMVDYDLRIPNLPGFCMEKWLGDQSRLLQDLAQKSKRNRARNSGSSQSLCSDMGDTLQTVPYEINEDWVQLKLTEYETQNVVSLSIV